MTVEVLTARSAPASARKALEELWTRVQALGWLAGAQPRVVLQTGPGAPGAVASTVDSLAAFLRDRAGVERMELLDLGRSGASSLPALDVSPADAAQVVGIAEPIVTLPRLWLEPFFLVTVTGVTPDPAGRLRGVLHAQAAALRAAGFRARRRSEVYEAHRLGGSDLAVVCGGAGSEGWWLASPNDVALDRVVAHAAGLDPRTLPDLEAVACHELAPPVALVGELPGLAGVARPAWRARLAGAGEALAAAGRFAVHDARAVRRNLGRVPHAVRRRLPSLLRRGGRPA